MVLIGPTPYSTCICELCGKEMGFPLNKGCECWPPTVTGLDIKRPDDFGEPHIVCPRISPSTPVAIGTKRNGTSLSR